MDSGHSDIRLNPDERQLIEDVRTLPHDKQTAVFHVIGRIVQEELDKPQPPVRLRRRRRSAQRPILQLVK